MSSTLIVTIILAYFAMLVLVGYFTSRTANESSYFIGNKQSIWWLVAIGMLSDSMSGVTFISVPGNVLNDNFYYMQMVIGYVLGYLVIAFILLPLYYRMNLTSIYTYLQSRYGVYGQKTGALFFIISRLVGSGARLYLTAIILQEYLFKQWNMPFWLGVSIIIALILVYTIKGGIRTLVFTDAIQSIVLLTGLLVCIGILVSKTDTGYLSILSQSAHVKWFNWDFTAGNYFFKHLLGGAFVCIAMTGLDQNMMQKNLSCKNIGEAQKNILTYGAIVFVVNIIFLSLGAVMIYFMQTKGIAMPTNETGKIVTDKLFPLLAFNHLGVIAGVAFVLGLAAATFSSADSVLTTLTTSTYIDLFGIDKKQLSQAQKDKYRNIMHFVFAVLLLLCILIIAALNNDALITTIFKIAGYTYGPLLGLFGFGIFSKRITTGWPVLLVCLLSPLIIYFITEIPANMLGGYKFGFETLLLNGLITYLGLWLFSRSASQTIPQ